MKTDARSHFEQFAAHLSRTVPLVLAPVQAMGMRQQPNLTRLRRLAFVALFTEQQQLGTWRGSWAEAKER